MLGMHHTTSGFLSAAQGLPIPSSALLALIAVLFLGALVLRGQRQASRFADAVPALQDAPSVAFRSSLPGTSASTAPKTSTSAHPHTHRGATMSSSTDSPSAGPAPRPASEFHLHWGRATIALLGVLALLTAVVTGILAPLTAVPAAVPLSAAGVFLFALVALRIMALLRRRSARRARVQSAIEEAMNPLQSSPWVNPTEAGIFDALSADDRGAGGPDSLQPIDEDGLPVGLERTFDAEVQDSGPVLGEAAEPVGPWEPRSVPRPKYLDLDKAQRIEPEALAAQTPLPRSDVKLTQRRFLDTQPAEQAPAASAGSAEQARPVGQIKTPKHDSMNLDEVLKRRRA